MNNKTITLIQINKGNSNFSSRVDQIKFIIEKFNPHIMVVNELNIDNGDNISRSQFENYRIETDRLDILDRTSRTGIIIHKSIHYQRRHDLEMDGLSTIWLQLNYPGKRPLLFQGLYRQYRRLDKPGSQTLSAQNIRWGSLIKKWTEANLEGHEVISMGDININTLNWDTPQNDPNPTNQTKVTMSKLLKEEILQKGSKIINTKPTRNDDTPNQNPSCIDVMITNRPDKITYHNSLPGFSDHKVQIMIRKTTEIISQVKYLKTRDYSNYSNLRYRDKILNHYLYLPTLYENDTEIITKNIQEIITNSLNSEAPEKTIKIKKIKKIPKYQKR